MADQALPLLLAFAIEKNLHGVPNHKNDTDPCMIHRKILACTLLFVQSSQPPLSNSTRGAGVARRLPAPSGPGDASTRSAGASASSAEQLPTGQVGP